MIAALLATAALGVAPHPPTPSLTLPAVARPRAYDVTLSIDPSESRFTASMDLDMEFLEPTSFLWLDGAGLDVERASLEQAGHAIRARAVETTTDFLGFAFEAPVDAGDARLRVSWSGEISSAELSGLFRETESGHSYAFTQFEALGARHVFPCFDEPAYKTPWRLTLEVPAGLTVVSNTPPERTTTKGTRQVVRFAQTRPLPSYLVAFAIGPFDVVDAGHAGRNATPLRILAMHGHARDAAVAARTLPPVVRALEDYFDVPYPYPKLDVVAIPRFNGAMENAGMITFEQAELLVPASDEKHLEAQRAATRVLAHETAHQWFGDLVTMKWWDDLWLNEAFATWMETRITARLHPEWHLDEAEVLERSHAIEEDERVSARQIRQPIVSDDDVVNAFDGITYDKGAAILRMFEVALGPETFRRGVTRYLRAHGDGSATTADFLAAVSAEAGRDVAPEFATFLDAPGAPLLDVALDCAAPNAPALTITQTRLLPVGSRGGAARTWRVPLCVDAGHGDARSHACTTLAGETTRIALEGGCPDWALAGAGAPGYYRVHYEGDLLARLEKNAAHLTPVERLAAFDDALSLFEAGRIAPSDALPLVDAAARADDPREGARAAEVASSLEDDELVAGDARAAWHRWVGAAFGPAARRLGTIPSPDEDEVRTAARPAVLSAAIVEGEDPALGREAAARGREFLAKPGSLPPRLAEVALRALARSGSAADFERIARAAATETEPRRKIVLAAALLSFRDPRLFARGLASIEGPHRAPYESFRLAFFAWTEHENRDAAWAWTKAHFDELATKAPRESAAELFALPGGFCDRPHRDEVAAFLGPRADEIVGGPRVLAETLESIDLCIARRDAQAAEVSAWVLAHAPAARQDESALRK